jgi:hypothetical protein
MAPFAGKLVLFGGSGPGQVYDETWEWDGMAWIQRKAVGPAGRTGAEMAALGGKLVLFGGNALRGTTFTYFPDTWQWDGIMWSQFNVSGPPARTGAGMTSR